MKGFQKIALQPGESRQLTFTLAAADLGFYDDHMVYGVEAGLFKVWVGPNAAEGLEGEFRVMG